MLPTCEQNRTTRTILESNIIYSKKTSYKEQALESTIDIATNIWMVEKDRNTTDWKLKKS